MTQRCVYCLQTDGEPIFPTRSRSGDEFQVIACNCGVWYLWPRPDEEMLARAYTDDYYGSGGDRKKFVGWIEFLVDHFRYARARRVQRYTQKGRVLDIGCGNGAFLAALIAEGYEAHGLEREGEAARRSEAVEGLQLTTAPLTKDTFQPSAFDAVTLWHVFEHLPNPRAILATAVEILKPGGHLFLSMPNRDSWQARWFRADWFHLDPPRHLFIMGAAQLKRELSQHGFEVREVRHFSLEQNPFGFLQSGLNRWGRHRDDLFEALKGGRPRGRRLGLQRLLMLLSSPLCVGLALLEAVFGRGGTIELVARKAYEPPAVSTRSEAKTKRQPL